MKKKVNYRPNFLLILYCINIFILFLAPFSYSYFDGDNIASLRCIIVFKVSFLGNWLEHRIFTHISEGTFTGFANEVGTYSKLIIPFIIVGLVFSFLGAIFVGARKDAFETNEKRIKQITVLKIIGSSFSILGGLFGFISLIYYSVFKSSIIQPYDDFGGFHPSRTPDIEFAYGYIISLTIFIMFVITSLIVLILTLRTVYHSKKPQIINNKKTELINDKSNILGEELSIEEKEKVSVE